MISACDYERKLAKRRNIGLTTTRQINAATAGIGGTDSPIWVEWVIKPVCVSQ